MKIQQQSVDQLLHKNIPADYEGKILAKGFPTSPGATVGAVIFDADDAVEQEKTKKVLLLREETKPEDIHKFFVAEGILTCRGWKTSHATIVAIGMGKPCVLWTEDIKVDINKKIEKIGEIEIQERDILTINRSTSNVY